MFQLDRYTPKLLELFSAKGGSNWLVQELGDGTNIGEAQAIETWAYQYYELFVYLFSFLS